MVLFKAPAASSQDPLFMAPQAIVDQTRGYNKAFITLALIPSKPVAPEGRSELSFGSDCFASVDQHLKLHPSLQDLHVKHQTLLALCASSCVWQATDLVRTGPDW